VKRIIAEVARHRGARMQSDDLTILCVDRVADREPTPARGAAFAGAV
jgi:hypothetical protein